MSEPLSQSRRLNRHEMSEFSVSDAECHLRTDDRLERVGADECRGAVAFPELAWRDAINRDAYAAELHELLLPGPRGKWRVERGTEALHPGQRRNHTDHLDEPLASGDQIVPR